MQRILVATDDDTVAAQVDAALGSSSTQVLRVRTGRVVRAAVIEHSPDLVVLDLQIGSMGGMAVSLDLRLEEGAGRLDPQRILLLLDRDADMFLARRAEADGWLVKPLDSIRLKRAASAIVGGGEFREEPRTALGRA